MIPHVFLDKLPFNLSSKICRQDGYMDALETKDVKEFIRLLKEHEWTAEDEHISREQLENYFERLDKLAGEALCGN